MSSENGVSGRSRRIDCPVCAVTMDTVKRETVEFDRCPNCRGVWLDRGELEKLVAIEQDEDGEPIYEQPAGENDDPEPAEKLSTRRSLFGHLFDTD